MELKRGYKQTEVGVIPEDWALLPLGDLVNYTKGFPFRAADYQSHGIRILRVSDTTYDGVKEGERIYIDEQKAREFRRWSLKENDLVLSTVGSKPPMYDSMVGKVTLIKPKDCGALLNQNAVILRSTKWVTTTPRLLHNHLRQDRYLRYIETIFRGNANQASITLEDLFKYPIPLPQTRAEQEAIATALSDVDALLGGLDRLIAKKRDLKQAAMQQLLTGKTRLPSFHGDWEVKPLGAVVDTDPENLSSSTVPEFAFNYIALEDVDRGILRSHSEQRFATAPSRARRKLRPDDVLASTVRPNLQSHLLFRAQSGNWVCSTGFCVVRCRPNVTHPAYVFFHLFANCLSRQIEALLTGSNYPAINSGDVRSLAIPLPDYPEQAAIAAVLSDMDVELSVLEARRNKTRDLKQAMMQELLTGKTRLVPTGDTHA